MNDTPKIISASDRLPNIDGDTLAELRDHVAEWIELYGEAAVIDVHASDYSATFEVSYKRPESDVDRARAEQQRRQAEEWERRQLATLLAKYPDAAK